MGQKKIIGVRCEISDKKAVFDDDRVVLIDSTAYFVHKCNIRFTEQEQPYIRAGRVVGQDGKRTLVDLCVNWGQEVLEIPNSLLVYN